ncbi:MAG: GTP-binding protein, partial [Phycisphaerales bacterium]|nr:GTP-binding protein [Phycisphaerales bacterium]
MGSVSTRDIRNVLLCGSQFSGKTTLIERMLAHTKTIAKMGSIATKDTVCDYEPEEKSHGHSLAAHRRQLVRSGGELHQRPSHRHRHLPVHRRQHPP